MISADSFPHPRRSATPRGSSEPAPAERPTHERPTHERLRRAAVELFARRGYDGTSMSEIAARVGVRKASLYNYYPSKEALLTELLDESLGAWRRASSPALGEAGPLRERLSKHIRAAVAFTVENPEQVSIVRIAGTQIGGELGREMHRRLSEQRQEYLATLEAFFIAAIAAGEVATAEPMALALATRIFLDGLLSNLIFRTVQVEELTRRLPRLWAFFWRGLGGVVPQPEQEGAG